MGETRLLEYDAEAKEHRVTLPFSKALVRLLEETGGRAYFPEVACCWQAGQSDVVADWLGNHVNTDATVMVLLGADVIRRYEGGGSFKIGNYLVAYRLGHDQPVHVGEGVVAEQGYFPGKGGREHDPRLDPPDDLVLSIRGLPLMYADTARLMGCMVHENTKVRDLFYAVANLSPEQRSLLLKRVRDAGWR